MATFWICPGGKNRPAAEKSGGINVKREKIRKVQHDLLYNGDSPYSNNSRTVLFSVSPRIVHGKTDRDVRLRERNKSFNIELVSSDGTPATFEFDKNTGASNIADLRVKNVVYKNGSYVINEQYEESYCSAYGEEKANTFTVNTYYAPTQKYVKFDLEFDTESCKYLGEQSTARAFFLITEYPNDFKQEFTGYSMILNESRDFRVAGFLTLLILIMFGIILLSIALGFFSSRKEATGKSLISVNVFMIIVIILSFILMGFI